MCGTAAASRDKTGVRGNCLKSASVATVTISRCQSGGRSPLISNVVHRNLRGIYPIMQRGIIQLASGPIDAKRLFRRRRRLPVTAAPTAVYTRGAISHHGVVVLIPVLERRALVPLGHETSSPGRSDGGSGSRSVP